MGCHTLSSTVHFLLSVAASAPVAQHQSTPFCAVCVVGHHIVLNADPVEARFSHVKWLLSEPVHSTGFNFMQFSVSGNRAWSSSR